MYDTIHFWVHRADIGFDPFLIKSFLLNITEKTTIRGYSVSGNLDNFLIKITEGGISIKGSISKFYFGNNIQTLSLQQTKEAIQMLSDKLQLSLFQAKVTRIDIGAVLITKHAPATYFKYLGNKPRFERLLKTNNSLCYQTKKKILAFYDKFLEAKKSGMKIPDEFKKKNLLRYELRFSERLSSQLNEKAITGETLCKQAFYSKLVQLWKNEYASIDKINSSQQLNYEEISTPKDAKEAFMSILLVNEDISRIENYVNELKSNSTFAYPRDYTRLNKDLMNLISNSSNKQNKQIIELNEIIMKT